MVGAIRIGMRSEMMVSVDIDSRMEGFISYIMKSIYYSIQEKNFYFLIIHTVEIIIDCRNTYAINYSILQIHIL